MSETPTLGLFKHDNPATNTDIFDIDKAINQNLDKIDNGVKKDRQRLDSLEASNTIYNFKGKAATLAAIQLKPSIKGDVWYCIEDSTYYAYTGTDWIPVNLNLKLGVIDDLQTKIIKVIQEVETPTPVTGTKINIKDSVEAKITEFNISGNHKQETREGYNVLDISKYAYSESESTLNAGTVTVKDGIITLNATNATNLMTARSNSVQADNRKLIPAGTYYFGVNCNLYPKNGGTLLQAKIGVQTLAEDYYLSQWYITCEKSKTDSFKLLISNDTNKTDYEPYGVMPSPNYSSEVKTVYNQGSTEIIKCNKNIFKMKDKYFTTKGRNQYQCLYLKSYTANSVTVWTQYGGTYQFAYIIIPNLKPNTSYSLRYDLTKNETTYSPNMSLQNGKKTDNNGNLEIMINLGNNANASVAGKNIVFDNIQIEEGATMTPYVNHQEEIYNMPIQQEMLEEDKFDWDNEKEVHNWKKLVINGTENWSMFSNTPKLGLFILSIDDIKSNQEEYAIEDIICTHFEAKSLNNTWLGKEGISVGNKQIRIFCSSNDTNTVEKWKAYLAAQYNAGTPVIVYYKLETPTQLAFTAQQKEVAKQIKQAKTYDGVTNIYSECEVEPNLEIIYKKNIQTLFDNTLI